MDTQQRRERLTRNYNEIQLRLKIKDTFSFWRCVYLLILVMRDIAAEIGWRSTIKRSTEELVKQLRSEKK